MLKLKLQYFGHLIRRTESLGKTLMLGKIEGRRRGWQDEIVGWHQPTQWKWVWVSCGSWWCTGKPGVLQSMGSQRVDVTERLNWTELKKMSFNGSKHLIEHFIVGEWDSGWNSRSLTLILVHPSLLYTLSPRWVTAPCLDVNEQVSHMDCNPSVLHSIGEMLSYFMTWEEKRQVLYC